MAHHGPHLLSVAHPMVHGWKVVLDLQLFEMLVGIFLDRGVILSLSWEHFSN